MKKARRQEGKKAFSTLLALLAAGGIVLAGCGGGGGGGSVSNSSNSGGSSNNTVSKSTYTGAASKGDLAVFSFDGKNLTYEISGPVFGNKSGTLTLEKVAPNSPVYRNPEGDVYTFFAGKLGVAEVDFDNNQVAYVVGLKDVKAPDMQELAGKDLVYFEALNDGTTSIKELKLGNGTWELYDLNGNEISNGTFEIKNNYLVAKEDNKTIANVIIEPGSRVAFVVDYADGSGFGIGLERKKLTSEDVVGTYLNHYYNDENDIECVGKLTIQEENGKITYNYDETWCSDGQPEDDKGVILLNQLCDGTPFDGIACGKSDITGDESEIFIDAQDGYYITKSGYAIGAKVE